MVERSSKHASAAVAQKALAVEVATILSLHSLASDLPPAFGASALRDASIAQPLALMMVESARKKCLAAIASEALRVEERAVGF